MHTFESKTNGVRFVVNGDFSGDVIIITGGVGDSKLKKQEFSLPFEDLKCLIAAYVRQSRIEVLENATDDEVLT